MRRRAAICTFAMFLISAFFGLSNEAPRAHATCASNGPAGTLFQPPAGKTVLMIGQGNDSINAYDDATQVKPGGVMFYVDLFSRNMYNVLYTEATGGNGRRNIAELLTRYPDSTMQVGLNMAGQRHPAVGITYLDEINSGLHDGNIEILRDWIIKADRPVFLRIGYEFDGGHNKYDPTKYKEAYKRIAQRLRSTGPIGRELPESHKAKNVSFVWHSYASSPYGGYPISAWYPGDTVVDWVGISTFGHAYNASSMTRAHGIADFADAHGKPLMIAESTPVGQGTGAGQKSWDDWFVPMINFIDQRGVDAWSYINTDWETWEMFAGQGWGDTRVQANEVVFANWMSEISQAQYMNATPTLFCQLGYEKT